MKKRIAVTMVFCLLATGTVVTGSRAYAQFPEDEPSSAKREQIRKRIETLRMWKLTEELDLDEKTSAKLFPVISKYDKERAKLQHTIRQDMRELRRSLQSDKDADYQGMLDRLEKNHREMQRIEDDEMKELKTILTAKQQAQYLLFNMKFKREIRRMIDDSRGKRRHGKKGDRKYDRDRPDRGDMSYRGERQYDQ
jgi:Spy/CpxP family protein refolding chaperone